MHRGSGSCKRIENICCLYHKSMALVSSTEWGMAGLYRQWRRGGQHRGQYRAAQRSIPASDTRASSAGSKCYEVASNYRPRTPPASQQKLHTCTDYKPLSAQLNGDLTAPA